ncbi:MAG: hypothetical protein MUP16_04905 [Sedimentisphaerales bacterium]|nr:hypothetical protein [Sedimentisphaerales bacterium]
MNFNCNDKTRQVKQKSSLVSRLSSLAIIISLFITLLRSQSAGSRLALTKDRPRGHIPPLAVTSASAGRLPPTGLPGIIVSPNRADGAKLKIAELHQPENDWLDELIERIWTVESGRQLAPPDGDGGQAIGPLQIHQCVLDDVNKHYGTNYTRSDLRRSGKAKIIARMYIEMWMERHKEEIACRIFNGGPRGWNEKSTDNYWSKINGR